MNPVLSICIPTFNRITYLKKTINQLLAILPVDDTIEIIISDNHSTDETYQYCNELIGKYDFIKYNRQDKNIGLDLNAFSAIERSSADYCWLLSDDDIPLKNSLSRICNVIHEFKPILVYLNYSGFKNDQEIEHLKIENKSDEICAYNHEEFLSNHLLNHFSATVIQKIYFIKYKHILSDYKSMQFLRGYVLCISDYMILTEKKLCVYIGEVSLLTRNIENLMGNSYNPLSIVSEIALHYKCLRKNKLISKQTESKVVNYYLRGFYHIIIPMRLFYNDVDTSFYLQRIHRYCYRFKNYYIYNLPYLILPLIILKPLRKFYLVYIRRK